MWEALGIEHRLTRSRRPQTTGMVERFNGRIADVLRTHRFRDGEDVTHTLLRYAIWFIEGHMIVRDLTDLQHHRRLQPKIVHIEIDTSITSNIERFYRT